MKSNRNEIRGMSQNWQLVGVILTLQAEATVDVVSAV